MKPLLPFFLLSLILLFSTTSKASSGDRSRPFQQCLDVCKKRPCAPSALPLSLRLTLWTCNDDCAYTCMHEVTDISISEGRAMQQFYGKWPFWRWFGMQEPASVAFSLMNFWVHWKGYKKIRRAIPSGHPLKGILSLWSFISMNAWIWSAVFHTRDKPSTEKMDYFSAALVFMVSLNLIVSRFFFIGRPTRRSLHRLWTLACFIVYIAHVSYLTLSTRFDYTYNILFNLTIGLIHNFFWILYSLPSSETPIRRFPPTPSVPRNYRPRCATKAAICVALTMGAMSLELLDFPPLGRILDAHALWHAATVPIGVLWYDFLIEDALDDGWRPIKL